MDAAEIAMRYREYAANCLRVAQDTCDPETKLSLVDMAQVWVTLAEQTEKTGTPNRSMTHQQEVGSKAK